MGQKFYRPSALRIDARVIGDESDALAAKRRELLRLQNIKARLHAPGAARALPSRERRRATRREHRHKNTKPKNLRPRARESAQMVPLCGNRTTIQ